MPFVALRWMESRTTNTNTNTNTTTTNQATHPEHAPAIHVKVDWAPKNSALLEQSSRLCKPASGAASASATPSARPPKQQSTKRRKPRSYAR